MVMKVKVDKNPVIIGRISIMNILIINLLPY